MTDIQFLDHSTVTLIDTMGNDDSIVRAARVSTGRDDNTDGGDKLINYLMREKHASPFEHVTATFRVHTPIFVAREFMRHRTLSFNEESGRYRELEPVFYQPPADRPLVQEGKPGAYTFVPGSREQAEDVDLTIPLASANAYDQYRHLLNIGVAREVARIVLPVNIYTSFYVTGNLRNWFNFASLRGTEQALDEIRQVSIAIEWHLSLIAPIANGAWIDNGRGQL